MPPAAVLPEPICAPAPDVPGLRLECDDAVAAALEAIGEGHPPVTRISFDYGPCNDVRFNVVSDCAVHMLGTVTVEFLGMLGRPAIVHVTASGSGATATVVD
jgi:hypothetical protein